MVAKVSSLYASLHLGYVVLSGFMMTESLFCIFFLLFLIYFFSFSHSFFLSGLFLGIASMFRPIGHYLIYILFFVFLFSDGPILLRFKKFGTFLVGWILVVGGWLLRNWWLTGYIFFHTLPGYHFTFYFAVPVHMKVYNSLFKPSLFSVDDKVKEQIKLNEQKIGRKLKGIEICQIKESVAVNYALKYPILTIKHGLYNMFKTVIALHSSEILKICGVGFAWTYNKGITFWTLIKRYLNPPIKNPFLILIIWMEILCSCFILLGFFLGIIRSCFSLSLFCSTIKLLPFFLLMIGLTCVVGFARLRLPIEHFLIIVSLHFWIDFFLHVGERLNGRNCFQK